MENRQYSDSERSLAGKVPAFTTVTASPCAATASTAARLWLTKAIRHGRLAASSASIAHFRNRQPCGYSAIGSGVCRFGRVRRAGRPYRLFAAKEFAVAAAFRMHRDDEVVCLAEPCRHRGGQPGFHLDMDARIAGDETCEQGRHDAGAVIVHHAQPHHAFDLALGEPADGFLVEVKNLPGIPKQSFAGGAQIDVCLGSVEQLGAEAIFQTLDLHAHGRLGPVQHDGRTGEGAVLRHRDERRNRSGSRLVFITERYFFYQLNSIP